MDFGLSSKTIEKIKSVFSNFPEIEKAIVFGSRADGTYSEGSDIDIAIYGSISFKMMVDINRQLDELNLPYKIDVLIFRTISNPELAAVIDKGGVVLYEREVE